MNNNQSLDQDFYNAIYSYFVKRVNSAGVAEDLTQEVFLKIAKRESDTNIDSVQAFVFTIARNTLFDHYRKSNNNQEEYDENSYSIEGDDADGQQEIFNCIVHMIPQLDEEDASLIKRVDIDGASQKALSEELNISYVTLKSRVQRARLKLRKYLTDCCSFEKDARGVLNSCNKK